MATHSSILTWRIPWTVEPGGLHSMGSQRDRNDWAANTWLNNSPLYSYTTIYLSIQWLHFPFSLSCIGEGNGNPLQCSCLENPRDGGAWWAAVYGVAQSRTQLKWLSSSSSIHWQTIGLFCPLAIVNSAATNIHNYLSTKMNEVLTPAQTWVNMENMLYEKNPVTKGLSP